MTSSLESCLDAEHQRIRDLAREAESVVPTGDEPRIRYRLTDTFTSVLSRHLAAVDDVLLPEANSWLSDGHQQVQEYVRHARGLEEALHRMKAHLYGDATAAHVGWDAIWREMGTWLDDHARHEMELSSAIAGRLGVQQLQHLTKKLMEMEEREPTRPHPYSPHTGWPGRLARRFWRVADGFWDHAEGRLIPHREPDPPAKPDSLMHRYFTGAPTHRTED